MSTDPCLIDLEKPPLPQPPSPRPGMPNRVVLHQKIKGATKGEHEPPLDQCVPFKGFKSPPKNSAI